MSYTKIYYDDIWAVTSESSNICATWVEELDSLRESFTAFVESDGFKGQAASNMKNYIEQVHGILISVISSVMKMYEALAISYYGSYTRLVDSGDGSEFGMRYTTIVSDEVSDTGSIQRKLNNIIYSTEQVEIAANNVKSKISDLVSLASSPKTYNLYEQIAAAKEKAQTVHNNVIAYEASRVNDFDEIDRLITQALSIINAQIGNNRVAIIAYQSGSIGNMCDPSQLLADINALGEKFNIIISNECFEADSYLVLDRDKYLEEEAKKDREWARWAAIGVAVVASIALTAVTAGAYGPVGCAVVGAISGGFSAAASGLADNYVENGSFIEGLDYKEFGKEVFIGVVGGAVTGYVGAVSTGSAIKQPIKRGFVELGKTAATEGSKAVAGTIWEVGETAYEVGQAIVEGKPGEDVKAVLNEGISEIKVEALDGAKNVLVEGGKSFVGGMVGGKFDIDTSDKSVFQKASEKVVQGATEGLAGGAISTAWNIGEAVLDEDSSTTVETAVKQGIKETVQGVAGSSTSALVSDGLFAGVDDIDNKSGKVLGNIVKDTVGDTTEDIAKGVSGRAVDYFYGDEKDADKIFGDIWEEDLDGGFKIVEHAGDAITDNVNDELVKKEKFYNDLRQIDKDQDGNIQVVQFDDYAVTKQDYDAAVKNAGKGAYKDKTVQDILGLPKDTNIRSGKVHTVEIDRLEEYSSNRKTTDAVTVGEKYTFRKSYLESTLNAAGKGEYKGKTAQEILGVPDDTDLSDNNLTQTRVKKEKFHDDYSEEAKKIHVSNLSRETRMEREKERAEREKQEKKERKNLSK